MKNNADIQTVQAPPSLYQNRHRHRTFDNVMRVLIWASAAITVAVLVVIILYILINGLPHVSIQFITDIYEQSGSRKGILPMIINTLYMILLTLIISVPIGIATAIYLTQYAKQGRLVKIIRFTTEILSGIPSIIYGLFGMTFFVIFMKLGISILAGALTLSIMILPTIIRTVEEALKSVPKQYKEGALALGAGKFRVVMGIVLPCAMPGVLTAVILAIGRIVGESAALIFTAGMVYKMPTDFFRHIFSSGRTLTVHLYQTAMLGDPLGSVFATASVLLIIVFLLNRLANLMTRLFKKD